MRTLRAGRERGATLMIALGMLAVILLLGATTASLLALDERIARNHRGQATALLAAQLALDDACEEIRLGNRVDAAFPASAGCRDDAQGSGLCRAGAHAPGWRSPQLLGIEKGSAAYGSMTGRRLAPLRGVAPPRYLIELLPPEKNSEDSRPLYRISAVGFGQGGAQAALQSVVRRDQGDTAADVRCIRLAWRPLFLDSEVNP